MILTYLKRINHTYL